MKYDIGFIPQEWEQDAGCTTYTKVKLLEISVVKDDKNICSWIDVCPWSRTDTCRTCPMGGIK